MATYRQLLKKAFRTEQHFLVAARQAAIAAGLTSGRVLINKNVISKLEKKAAGTIHSTFSGLPRDLQNNLRDVSYEFTQKVFQESQRLVPIDKRYIGKYNPNVGRLKRSIGMPRNKLYEQNGGLVELVTEKSRRKYLKDPTSYSDIQNLYQAGTEDLWAYAEEVKKLKIPKGYYDKKHYDFISSYFTRESANHRKKRQLFVDKKGNLYSATVRYNPDEITNIGLNYKDFNPIDVKKFKKTSAKEHAGGNQELKNSGKISETKTGWTISYDPTRLGARFNYASLQHEMPDSVYKHKVGQSLYLLTAYEKYVKQFREAVKAKAVDTFKERLKQND